MIVKPRIKGFICTTAHPVGCEESVRLQMEYAKSNPVKNGPKRVLVIGSSGGYGLASRIMAAFGCGADTIGVHFDKAPKASRTGTAGFYTSRAFEEFAKKEGRMAYDVNGDAFSKDIKNQTLEMIGNLPGGKVDCVIYSLAAPRKTDPVTGKMYNSVIKPIGKSFEEKSVNVNTGEISKVKIEPANEQEIEETVAVMGGSDWSEWIELLLEHNMLETGASTFAFSYIGPEQTHAMYTDGTIGRAKLDLEKTSHELDKKLQAIDGKAFVSVNKALVTQSSSAIPVVPLYIMLLYKVMKENGTHENCIEQAQRLFAYLFGNESNGDYKGVQIDHKKRLRLDDLEMEESVQTKVKDLMKQATSSNISEISDIQGYQDAFLQIFGFNIPGVDYELDVDIM